MGSKPTDRQLCDAVQRPGVFGLMKFSDAGHRREKRGREEREKKEKDGKQKREKTKKKRRSEEITNSHLKLGDCHKRGGNL